jgi:hypothetical protein
VAYGGPAEFARIGGLTKALLALTGVSAAVAVVSAITQYGLRDKADAYIADPTALETSFKNSLTSYNTVGAVAMVTSIVSLVVTVLWTFRMAKNVAALDRPNASFRPAATIAVNVLGSCTLGVLQFMMWKELWRGSDPDGAPGDLEWKKKPYPSIILIYLAFSVAAGVLGLTAGAIAGINSATSSNKTLDLAKNLHNHFPTLLASGLLAAGAMVCFFVLVRQLGTRHMQATGEA